MNVQICSWIPQGAEQVPTETFLGHFWVPRRNQEGPAIDPKSVHAQKKSAIIDIASCSLFLLLLRVQEASVLDAGVHVWSMLGRRRVDVGVELVRSWVDLESVCLPVCLSACLCMPAIHPETITKQHGLAVCTKRFNSPGLWPRAC